MYIYIFMYIYIYAFIYTMNVRTAMESIQIVRLCEGADNVYSELSLLHWSHKNSALKGVMAFQPITKNILYKANCTRNVFLTGYNHYGYFLFS